MKAAAPSPIDKPRATPPRATDGERQVVLVVEDQP